MTIKEMCAQAYATARARGFYDATKEGPPVWLCLIHSEVSEALEEHREQTEGWRERFAYELADVVLRVAGTAEAMGIDLEAAIVAKMAKNEARPPRHGGKLY